MIVWTESIDVDQPADKVLRAVLDQHTLMQWSAWPEATGYSCAIDGDGTTPGSSIVFTSPTGEEVGLQTIITVSDSTISNRLRNRGPGGKFLEPEVEFKVERLSPHRSRVLLDFRVTPPVPTPLQPLARFYLNRKVRPLHRLDLKNLKNLLENQSS